MMRKTFTYTTLMTLAAVLLLCSGCKGLRGGKKGLPAEEDLNLGPNGGYIDTDSLTDGRGIEGVPYGQPGQFAPVLFSYDSSQVAPSERPKMDEIADEMSREGHLTLIVEGHCDERGDREYNMALGEHRALAVRAYLVGLGIDGERISTKSYGEENPVAYGHDEGAWSQNRRGEFMLYQ